jgi:hypothetical protein
MQQRDAERGAGLRVRLEALPLGEQLLAVVGERAADHVRAGRVRRRDAGGRAQPDDLEALVLVALDRVHPP